MYGISIIAEGPALPLPLVEALEAERLVFFCGAGISIGTGLPDFRDLTLGAIKELTLTDDNCPTDPALRDAFCTGQFDKALDILERGATGNALRDFVTRRLAKRIRRRADLVLHEAILALARRRDALDGSERGYRLVTTNYDDRFERAGLHRRWIESAPHLSRPRSDGERPGYATFLHGRIENDAHKRDPARRELVLTSADFGNAYLRDGFAARFVLELFREFTVLFIGYSINDPVMRYLVDIFATEQRSQRKGQFNEAFAIASFKKGQEAHVEALWKSKNVTPILYDDTGRHKRLTEFMTEWARLHTSGSNGRFSTLLEITRQPYGADLEDSRVRTAAWALGDEHSRTAERLAGLTSDRGVAAIEHDASGAPTPPDAAHISWFGPLLEAEVLDPRDHRFPRQTCKLSNIRDVVRHLCRWAMRHLETRELVDWAIENERLLLSSLREPFFEALIGLPHSQPPPPAIATPYSNFWQALMEIAGRHNTTRDQQSLWRPGMAQPGPPESLAILLRQSEIQIAWPSKPWRWPDELLEEARSLSCLARFELMRFGHRTISHRYKDLFADPANREKARDDLAPYLDDLTSFLLTICRLGRMIEAPFAIGRSAKERPSISRDDHNDLRRDSFSWLIEAMVLSFVRAAADEKDLAVAIAMRWRLLWLREGFSLFGRLFLHAAMLLPERIAADPLVDDLLYQREVLWSDEFRAEVLPLFRLRVAAASRERRLALIERVMASPPAGIYSEGEDAIVDRRRGHSLAKLKRGGVALDERAFALAEAYLTENPPRPDPRADEVFGFTDTERVGAIGIGASLVGQPIEVILASLRAERDPQGWPIETWDRAKRVADWLKEEPRRVVEGLEAFARELSLVDGAVDGIFWALSSLKPEQLDATEINAAINLVLHHNERLIIPNASAVAGWLAHLASSPNSAIDDERFFRVWDQTRAHAPEEEVPTEYNNDLDTDDIGEKLAVALRDRLWQTKPRVAQGLREPFRSRIELLVHGETLAGLHARLVCMQALDALFALDPDWARNHLLPRLSWQEAFAEQAPWHWQAHLLYGTWSLQLSHAYRADFVEMLGIPTDRDSDTFRAACQRFAALGAIYGLFSEAESKRGFRAIGPEGGVIVLDTLCRRMVETDKPTDMWRKSIGPWLEHWPPDKRLCTEQAVEAAAELIIEADDAFPEALRWAEKRSLIKPLADRDRILWRLTDDQQKVERRSILADIYPAELCRFLSQILSGLQLRQHERQNLTAVIKRVEGGLDPKKKPPVILDQLKQLL